MDLQRGIIVLTVCPTRQFLAGAFGRAGQLLRASTGPLDQEHSG